MHPKKGEVVAGVSELITAVEILLGCNKLLNECVQNSAECAKCAKF